jgi:DNA polymerase-1
MSERSPLLVVDGDNLAHRAYHSTPKSVRGTDDRPINAIVGFFSMLQRIYTEERPRQAFIAWDTLGVDTYRNKLWPDYQGGRVFEREIVEQLDRLPELCRAFGFGVGKAAGYEADDLMASAALAEAAAGGKALLFTTDRDSYQLASASITILSPQRGTREFKRIDPQAVVEYFGVLPEQVPDYKALAGDASDKIPGIRGIGPKAAASLLLRHGTLDRIVQAWGDTPESRLAKTFREVATMRSDAPVTLPEAPPDWASGSRALAAVGAEALAARLLTMVEG